MDYLLEKSTDKDALTKVNYSHFRYYQLSNAKTTIHRQEKTSVIRKSLFIFDWDDTIFPTSAFRTHQDKKDKYFMNKLVTMISYVEKIFTQMIKLYGASNIIIVTNGSNTWIDKCLNVDIIQKQFMNFQKLLKNNKIKTISASRPELVSKYPNTYYKWKQVVFEELFEKHFTHKQSDENLLNCITSIGDGLSEYKASDLASKHINNRVLNRVKFKSNPSIDGLIYQLKDLLTIIDEFAINLEGIEKNYSYMNESSYSDSTSW